MRGTGITSSNKSNLRARRIPDQSTERLSLGTIAAGVASVMLAGGATGALAQEALPTIEVEGATGSPDNTLQSNTGVARLGQVRDIPQTVTVINQQTLQQQGVTTLDQALRNVPGVTVAIGEGGGGLNGDQFRIRGFQAKGDIYLDGLRDFGVYVRDSFAYDSIQVLKGPSSESFGVGTTGGAINNVLKNAKLGNFMDIEGQVGLGPLARGVVDINRQIGQTTAVRVVAMGHQQDIVDRDNIFSDRWGVLGSAAFGLGTSTNLTLSYLHQEGERRPDFGEPIITPAGQIGRPISQFGTRRENFFGKEVDRDNTTVDLLTARFKTDVTDWLTVSNDTRFAHYDRGFIQTVPNCGTPASVPPSNCAASVAAGNFNVAYGIGGTGYNQTTWGAQNLTTAVAKVRIGGLRHEIIAGVDIFRQENERIAVINVGTKTPGTIAQPNFSSANYSVVENPLDRRTAEGTTAALFASDRVWLNEQFSLVGGVRLDHIKSSSTVRNGTTGVVTDFSSTDTLASPKASLIFEPNRQQTYYATYARSYSNLAGQFVANELNVFNAATPNLQPEKSDLYEVGTKLNFLNDRLGVTAALFRVTKGNALNSDPISGNLVQTNETQQVQGVELGLTGRVTDEWTVQLAYAYLDSEIITAAPTVAAQATLGNRVSFVPEHSASLWTTYDVAPMMKLPGKLLVGGGVFFTGEYFVNSANTAIIPNAVTLNGVISYEVGKYRVALNAYNLTDELYYDSSFANRATIAAGRTVMLTAGYKW